VKEIYAPPMAPQSNNDHHEKVAFPAIRGQRVNVPEEYA